jgi:hypothetical protein
MEVELVETRFPRNPVGHQVGNYMHQGDLFKRRAGKDVFIVGFATAYNALGLIGSERNGIFVLNETKRDVVLDEHLRVDSGWCGPRPKHRHELKRLEDLPDEEFLAWIKIHPRAREQYR